MHHFKTEIPNLLEEHLSRLYDRINYERQDPVDNEHFKLNKMREILTRLGNPQSKYPIIHVAGTKGKGSVSNMLARILSAGGKRTGVYTSPHLDSIHQRIEIDGKYISDEQLLEVLQRLDPIIREMDKQAECSESKKLTFFEITTAAAIEFFADQGCDAVVLEVGLGGRLDSTNVCVPVTSVITNISLDHTRQLGETLAEIAAEKAGIIKEGVPVVSGTVAPDAAKVIEEIANAKQAPLFVYGSDFKDCPVEGQEFRVEGEVSPETSNGSTPLTPVRYNVSELRLKLIGAHQRENASIAVAVIETLNARGWAIADSCIRTGLSIASLPGRTEIISTHATVVLDIAHNVASVKAMLSALRTDLVEWKNASLRSLIFATSRDKDARGMLEELLVHFDQVILTRYQDNPRGKSERKLFKLAQEIAEQKKSAGERVATFFMEPNPDSAWKFVNQGLGPAVNGELDSENKEKVLICISGSAFLVAELRQTCIAARIAT
ncbi:MAG: bifunctional folylpolyglutamate synthase/dihydrofolate synthase [Pirellulales bacterium]